MIGRTIVSAAAVLAALASPLSAQTVGIGTPTAGATNAIATTIASVVSNESDLQMRTQAMAGAAQYIPMINAGELDFGLANVVETRYSIEGTGWMDGRPNPDVRLVGTLFPFRAGILVADDSDIKTIADLAGKRVPSGFSGSPLAEYIFSAALATEGLTYDDVTRVPIPIIPRMFEALEQRIVDVSFGAYGAGRLKQMDTVLGGIRYLSLPDTDEALAAFREWLPGSDFVLITEDDPNSTGISGEAYLFQYDYVVFAGAHVPDGVVAEVARALYENAESLRKTSPIWSAFDPKNLAKDVGLDYHPGAVAFYESVGIMPN